jgi:hypothetical protein
MKLPDQVRALADKSFALLKNDPRHPSLYLKKLDDLVRSRGITLPSARR